MPKSDMIGTEGEIGDPAEAPAEAQEITLDRVVRFDHKDVLHSLL